MAESKNKAPAKEKAKRTCAVSKEQFLKDAKPISLVVNGVPMSAQPKDFSTGSFGWYLNGKTTIDVGGVPVDVQLGFNLTAVGSKELSKQAASK